MTAESRRSATIWLALALVLALAAVVRLQGLDGPALWWDEGLNAYLCKLAPGRLLTMSNAVLDSNPPTYRLLLGRWMRLVGDGAVQLRLPSVLYGLATVLAAWAWGRWQGGSAVGLTAALLMAFNPMAIYRQREAKAYPLVALFAALSCYLWLRYVLSRRDPDWRAWALYTLCTALAVGSHWYASFACVAQGLGLLVWLWRERVPRREAWTRLGRWALTQVVAVGVWLPWIAPSYRAALGGAAEAGLGRASLGPLGYVRDIAISLVAGPGVGGWVALLAVVATALAAAWALWPVRRSAPGAAAEANAARARLWGIVALIATPLALGYVAQRVLSFMDARFFFYVTTPLAVLVALGLARMRWLAAPVGVALLLAWGLSLPAARGPYGTPQDDLRPLAETVRRYVRADDAVVTAYIWQEGILRMYAPEVDAHYELGWYSADDVGAALHGLLDHHPRVWLVSFDVPLQDPANTGGWWLEQHATRLYQQVEGNNQLVGYTLCAAPSAGDAAVRFGAALDLRYTAGLADAGVGDAICLALAWSAAGPLPADCSAFVHLADATGKPWAQVDGSPVNGLRPFETLAEGETLADPRGLLITSEVPEGQYRLLVGVYNRADGQRLTTPQGADCVQVGVVRVRGR
ncbi:MAG: hypothetical protein GX557_07745 [Chloroflexi bacterium]|nr:hypothetical protein [Chloroflexota bacterium]